MGAFPAESSGTGSRRRESGGRPPRGGVRLPAGERRTQLIDTALTLIVQHGFQAVSVESVAQSAGVTRAVIYRHFRDLQDLLEAVVKRESHRALAQLSETTLTEVHGEPLEPMMESLRGYLLAVQAHPDTWRLVLLPSDGAPRALREHIARGRARVLAQMANAVEPLFRDSLVDDPEITAHILSASSDEYARLVLSDPVRYSPERLVEHARGWLRQIAVTAHPTPGSNPAPAPQGVSGSTPNSSLHRGRRLALRPIGRRRRNAQGEETPK